MEHADNGGAVPSPAGVTYTDVISIERHLRAALVDVRLVAETDLEGANYENACRAMKEHVRRRLDGRVGTLYPATTAVYLVAEGVHRYQGGKYWPQLTVGGIDPSWMGPAFLVALEKLGLPTFERETDGGFRYIAKILLHGGVPRYCAKDVLRKLIEELRRGAGDAQEIVAKWRQSRWDLVGIDIPAQRFLLQGGDEAVDLIDRVVEMVQTGAQGEPVDPGLLGLPTYLVAEYQSLGSSDRRLGKRIIPPRPTLKLDPYTGDGPALHLPQADSEVWQRWHVKVGTAERVRTFEVSRHRSLELPVDPPGTCLVECAGPTRRVSYDLCGPHKISVMFFDPGSGTLLRDQERLRSNRILVVAPVGTAFRKACATGEAIPEPQELPPLHGQWSRHRVRLLDLRELAAVWIGPASVVTGMPVTEATIAVAPQVARPEIVSRSVANAESSDGHPVFAAWPTVAIPDHTRPDKWRYRAMIDGTVHGGALTDFASTHGGYDLGTVWGAAPLAKVDLEVLGPLGSDLRTSFAVVEGLAVSTPDRVLGPGEKYDLVLQASDRLKVADAPAGAAAEVRSISSSQQVEIGDVYSQAKIVLSISVPRLSWSLRRNGVATLFGDESFSIAVDEIGEDNDEAVLVRTVRPVAARLVLMGPTGEVQSEGPVETQGQDGRWAFPLARTVTTAKSSDAPRLDLVVEIEGKERHRIGALLARHEVGSLDIESLVEGTETLLIARWTENRAFHGRELRLWSTTRPWEGPTILPIPDIARGSLEILVEDTAPAGVYTAEIAIADGWTPPSRPRTERTDIATVTLGRAVDAEERLRSLDPAEPRQYLELLLADRLPPPPSPGLLRGLYPDLLITLVEVLTAGGWRAIDSVTVSQLRAALFEEPDHIPAAVDQLVSEGRLSAKDALRLSILTLTDALDCPLGDADPTARGRLHRDAPVLAAALDGWPLDEAGVERWKRYVGWCPTDGPPFAGGPAMAFMLAWKPHRILALRDVLGPAEGGGLDDRAFVGAMLEWLFNESPDYIRTEKWQNAHNTLNDRRVRQDPQQAAFLAALKAEAAPNAAKFPPTVLAAAFHAVSFGGQNLKASRALREAVEFAPSLVRRSLLVAIVAHRGGLV